MKLSRLFGRTLREVPSAAQSVSHQLALRAGLVRPATRGTYGFLPLGQRVVQKIATVVREEMDALGGQEISMPIVTSDAGKDTAFAEVIACAGVGAGFFAIYSIKEYNCKVAQRGAARAGR